uniref:Uncharacterized protein n=1 Tax=Strongyloides venezuelensis TaxID=75913 RepID=A0A0K0G5J7_STRVS
MKRLKIDESEKKEDLRKRAEQAYLEEKRKINKKRRERKKEMKKHSKKHHNNNKKNIININISDYFPMALSNLRQIGGQSGVPPAEGGTFY